MIIIRRYQTRHPEKQVIIKLFFRILTCAAIVIIMLLSGKTPLQAQVRVTGHVFAEIVEPTALSAKANTSLTIKVNDNNNNNELVIARITLSDRPNLNVDFAVTTSHLEAENGQTFLFNAFVCPACFEDNQNTIAGEKLFILKAKPEKNILKKKNSIYNGRYRIVFMYN